MSISIEAIGIEEATAYFEHASEALVDSVSVKLQEVCQMIADYARGIAPVKTGNYAASIHAVQMGPLQFGITADAEYAAIIEFGSAPHPITPSSAKVLAFEVEGETVFAKYVMHPGTPPFLVLSRAMNDNIENIVEAVRQGVAEALAGGR